MSQSQLNNVTQMPDLGEVCQQIRQLLHEATHFDLAKRYEVATTITLVCDNENHYGQRCVKRLSEQVGLAERTVYEYLGVANTFTHLDIERIAERKGRHDRCVSWTHLVVLARVQCPQRREQLLDEALENGWTVNTLLKNIQVPDAEPRLAGQEQEQVVEQDTAPDEDLDDLVQYDDDGLDEDEEELDFEEVKGDLDCDHEVELDVPQPQPVGRQSRSAQIEFYARTIVETTECLEDLAIAAVEDDDCGAVDTERLRSAASVLEQLADRIDLANERSDVADSVAY